MIRNNVCLKVSALLPYFTFFVRFLLLVVVEDGVVDGGEIFAQRKLSYALLSPQLT